MSISHIGYTFVYIYVLLANEITFCLAVKGNKSNCKLRAIFYVIAKVFGNLVVRAHQTLVLFICIASDIAYFSLQDIK